jgi:hypothetical protein
MTNLVEPSKESYGSERAVLSIMMTMSFIIILIYALLKFPTLPPLRL